MFNKEEWEEIASCTDNPKVPENFVNDEFLESFVPADWKELFRDVTDKLVNVQQGFYDEYPGEIYDPTSDSSVWEKQLQSIRERLKCKLLRRGRSHGHQANAKAA